jgi:hypothetical protein
MESYFKRNGLMLGLMVVLLVGAALNILPPEAGIGGVMLSAAPFPINPNYTSIALAYRNENLIADEVLPRVTVPTSTFKYLQYNKGDRFTVPDTLVGRKGQPNQVEYGATEAQATVVDHGLDDYVPQEDIDNAANVPGYDPKGMAAEFTTELVALSREKRCADLVFSTASYDADHKATLAGTAQWSHASSDPMRAVTEAMDRCVMRPNILVLGRATATSLQLNPAMLKAWNGNEGDKGKIPRRALAELFEVEKVFIGEGWINIAKKGQAPNFVRVWGKSAALLHQNRRASNMQGTTFGYTAQFGSKIGAGWFDKNVGLKGCEVVRIGEQVKELIIAQDLGFLFDEATA